jgi:hypothetical protein
MNSRASAGGLDAVAIPPSLNPDTDGVGGADRRLDQGTGPVLRGDGESVTTRQGPPVAEGHPLERVGDVAGYEVLDLLRYRRS